MDKQVRAPAIRDRSGRLVVGMAEAIGARADASTVFATPVTADGATVIPVAQAVWGFGGGKGVKEAKNAPTESGVGGGGGAFVRPVGYLVLRNGKVKYRRITSLPVLLLAALAGAAAAILVRR